MIGDQNGFSVLGSQASALADSVPFSGRRPRTVGLGPGLRFSLFYRRLYASWNQRASSRTFPLGMETLPPCSAVCLDPRSLRGILGERWHIRYALRLRMVSGMPGIAATRNTTSSARMRIAFAFASCSPRPSTASVGTGLEPTPPWLDDRWLWRLDPDPTLRRERYREFIEEKIGCTERLWDRLVGQIYFGGRAWIESMQMVVDLNRRAMSIPTCGSMQAR